MGARQAQAREQRRFEGRADAERAAQIALAFSAATASSSCGCWSARRHGLPKWRYFCASIARSRPAAISGWNALYPASRASSSRCPRLWPLCVRSGGARRTTACFGFGRQPLNLAGILTPGPKLVVLRSGPRALYRDGIPIAFLASDSTRLLEPVELEIENLARLCAPRPRGASHAFDACGGLPNSKRRGPQPTGVPAPQG